MSQYTVIMHPDKKITCREKETLLNASIRQRGGISVGCKGGGCGFCKVRLISGEAELGFYSKTALTNEEYEQGLRLACKLTPLSELHIEIYKQQKIRNKLSK